ncbi:hypothetical protein KW542_06045 [Vibrio fluvialis]|uniref:hypothetical protein n=1 Tax=Vibrio sp. bablab_jr001 TaxID=2755067 RepID=UPI0018F1F920|nr:hypothetical protein [Vibrio sp. bablab_jr001]EKO3399021.1 hypothetical protein [Vibrio fluvialis]EKO3473892.1 hypothetical protein [Vibrio fluvialis]MBY8116164.1 hypothetical protein [Vibrio fluvialis]MBY8247903.1 hypothetical protein [Vibrio fluvialis]MBY8281741.1 hypothetical protein [Vibrio fluvialis]
MGSYIYDYLNDSILFDETLIKTYYYGVSEARLLSELQQYRQYCIMNLPQIAFDIQKHQSSLSCLGIKGFDSEQELKRAALYMDQMVLPDPVFPFSLPKHEPSEVFSKVVGLENKQEINRVGLAESAAYAIALRPFVAGDFLKFYPVSLHSEPPTEIPVGYSEVGFSDLLPEPIMSFLKEKTIVKSLKHIGSSYEVMDSLELGRAIGLWFDGHDSNQIEIYNLFEPQVIEANDATGKLVTRMLLPDTPPDKLQFDSWVEQSIHRSSFEYFAETCKKVTLANQLNSSLTCSSVLEAQLLSTHFFTDGKNIQENTVDGLLQMDLPFLSSVSPADLMNIRRNDGEEFKTFRVELESSLKELRHESDSSVIRRKIEDIEHELFESQVQKINAKLKSVKKVGIADAGVALATLSAGVATSGVSLIGTLACLFHGAKTYAEYQEKVKENPSYFAWKVKKSAQETQQSNARKPKYSLQSGLDVRNGTFITTPKP